MTTLFRLGQASGVAFIALAMSSAAFAQDAFPSRDITFVVQAAAGGASDRSSRALAAEMERQAQAGASRIDVEALAEAVNKALDPVPPVSEGKRPDELNATNDG